LNNTYKITIQTPLIRPGITIEAEVSERYLVPVMNDMMLYVRQFNEWQDMIKSVKQAQQETSCSARSDDRKKSNDRT
jgi:hypothetical protein